MVMLLPSFLPRSAMVERRGDPWMRPPAETFIERLYLLGLKDYQRDISTFALPTRDGLDSVTVATSFLV